MSDALFFAGEPNDDLETEIFEAWGIPPEQRTALSASDPVDRTYYLLSISMALHSIWPAHLANRWMSLRNDNPPFERETPIDYVSRRGIEGLKTVCELLGQIAKSRVE